MKTFKYFAVGLLLVSGLTMKAWKDNGKDEMSLRVYNDTDRKIDVEFSSKNVTLGKVTDIAKHSWGEIKLTDLKNIEIKSAGLVIGSAFVGMERLSINQRFESTDHSSLIVKELGKRHVVLQDLGY